MRIISDLHIHSRFSRATSERMNPTEIARWATAKGLAVVGTGDFTHPRWLQELRDTLQYDNESELYKLRNSQLPLRFMITTEVCTIFAVDGKAKKIHHVILSPTLETAEQINERLSKHGNLESDGRPILNVDASTIVEEVMEISQWNMIFPAHAWTPWFSVFGAFSGFDSIEQCYGDMTKHIHALETGLSSDPPMNWRLSALDKYTLLSNSDCHSYWPWRLGREANVFDLPEPRYSEIIRAITSKDPEHLKFTIETDPAYGKYHWTGHRRCNVSLSANDAVKLRNICPVCRKPLTKGVEQRVEELADRTLDIKPEKTIPFIRLLPLSEIISTLVHANSPDAETVWSVYNQLVKAFGDEYNILMDISRERLVSVAGKEVADAIIKVREQRAPVIPGFDGVYGQLVLDELKEDSQMKFHVRRVQQKNMTDFC